LDGDDEKVENEIYPTNSILRIRKTERKYGTRELVPKNDHKLSSIMIKSPKDRCSSKNNKTILKVQATHCRGRNRDRDVGHEINGGDEDGNPTKFDAALGYAGHAAADWLR
jgi:hypothetical protein